MNEEAKKKLEEVMTIYKYCGTGDGYFEKVFDEFIILYNEGTFNVSKQLKKLIVRDWAVRGLFCDGNGNETPYLTILTVWYEIDEIHHIMNFSNEDRQFFIDILNEVVIKEPNTRLVESMLLEYVKGKTILLDDGYSAGILLKILKNS